MYFTYCATVEEVKKTYRELALANHPDRGGDTEKMQAINAAYEKALASFDGQKSSGNDGKVHTYHYNEDLEKEIIEKIDQFPKLIRKRVDRLSLSWYT